MTTGTRTLRRCTNCNSYVPPDRDACAFCNGTEFAMVEEPVSPPKQMTWNTPLPPSLASEREDPVSDTYWRIGSLIAFVIVAIGLYLLQRDEIEYAWVYSLFIGAATAGGFWIVGMISLTKQQVERNGRIIEAIERKINQ